jgi:hypothetical protein
MTQQQLQGKDLQKWQQEQIVMMLGQGMSEQQAWHILDTKQSQLQIMGAIGRKEATHAVQPLMNVQVQYRGEDLQVRSLTANQVVLFYPWYLKDRPLKLTPHITEEQWDAFMSDVEKVRAPSILEKTRQIATYIVLISSMIIFVVIGLLNGQLVVGLMISAGMSALFMVFNRFCLSPKILPTIKQGVLSFEEKYRSQFQHFAKFKVIAGEAMVYTYVPRSNNDHHYGQANRHEVLVPSIPHSDRKFLFIFDDIIGIPTPMTVSPTIACSAVVVEEP